jgi:hypothetical protein
MRLLPFDTIVIDSPLSPAEAQVRLGDATGVKRLLRSRPSPLPFEGEVTGTEVRIQRAINYGNSFLPRINGRIEARAHGSRLTAHLAMHPLVIVFMAVWFGGVLAIGVPASVRTLLTGELTPRALIPVAMLIFGYGLVSVGFWMEAGAARSRLREILEGAEVAAANRTGR